MSNSNAIEILSVSAPGKIILHGEHSVVYGKLAIAGSVNLRTTTRINQSEKNVLKFSSTSLKSYYEVCFDKIKHFLSNIRIPFMDNEYNWEQPYLIQHEEFIKQISIFLKECVIQQSNDVLAFFYLFFGIIGLSNAQITPIEIKVESDLSIGAGLGSSASYSVSIAGALVQYIKQKVSKSIYWDIDLNKFNDKELDLINKWAFCAEKIIHGTPSGLDNTICTYGSLVEFRKGAKFNLLTMSHSVQVLLINTKIPRQTKKMVEIVASNRKQYPDIFEPILESMENISRNAINCYKQLSQSNDYYNELSKLFNVNQCLLNSLGVGHAKLDQAVIILAKYGLNGKLTGAGGGGYAISLIPPTLNESTLNEIVNELINNDFEVLKTGVGVQGVKINA